MDNKLNVCLLNDSFPPIIDGVANTVFNYASVINDKLGNAVVATPNYPGVADNYDFEVLRYKSFDTTGIIGYRAGYPFLPSLMAKIEDKNIDVIHTHCPAMSTFLARALRENVNAPIVFTYHTKFDIDLKKALKSNLLQEATIKVIIDNIEGCDDVWVVSEGAGENLRSLGYKGDYIVMENGVDFPRGRADKTEIEKIGQKYGIRKNVPTFLFVGRLMWYKGLKITFDALSMINKEGLDFQMIIIGDGSDAVEMKNYVIEIGIADKCIFTGAILDREELRACYTGADMFLFPSSYDTNGIVVREAAACGLGSVLIKGSCASEGITHGRNGYLIDENAESMADAVRVFINDIESAHRIGENAMNEIYISWEDSIRKAYDRYQWLIEKYHSPEYVKKTRFTDEALSKIGDVCDAFNKANKFRRDVTGGFLSVPKELAEKGSELKQGLIERKSEFKDKAEEKKEEFKEIIWQHFDRYL